MLLSLAKTLYWYVTKRSPCRVEIERTVDRTFPMIFESGWCQGYAEAVRFYTQWAHGSPDGAYDASMKLAGFAWQERERRRRSYEEDPA